MPSLVYDSSDASLNEYHDRLFHFEKSLTGHRLTALDNGTRRAATPQWGN